MLTGHKTSTQTQSLGGEYSAQLPVRVSSQVTYICLSRITVTWSTGQPPPPPPPTTYSYRDDPGPLHSKAFYGIRKFNLPPKMLN